MSVEGVDEDVPLQLFEICLNNREEYFPGEVITGKLLLVTSRPFKTGGIYIKFEGKGYVRWKTRSAHLCGLHEAEFVHENKKYFSNVFRYDLDFLPEGSSVLAFEFELPTGIPESIDAGTVMKQLKICYSIEALIRTPTEDYTQQKYFIVKTILNLNTYPELSLPICKTIKEAMFESCWSSSGRIIIISFSIRKQGFVPGEQIRAELAITDKYKGETSILGVEMHLIQEIDLRIRTASRVRRRIVAKCDMVHSIPVSHLQTGPKGRTRNDHQRKINLFLTIPDDILISYGNLEKQVHDFISVRYFLRMSMEQPSFPYNPLQMHLPIKIGTVFIKEQKVVAPILLLAPVPLALPRPKVSSDVGCKPNNNISQRQDKQIVDSVPVPDTKILSSANINVPPEIFINSKSSLTILEQPTSSRHLSPRSPKRKLGITNTVGDLYGDSHKPLEAFGSGDSDSADSFRSGMEELQRA